MAIIRAQGGGGLPDQVVLSSAQTGTGPSTNVCDRGGDVGQPAVLDIVSTVGATPTVTVDVQGSIDGANWWNVAYALNSPIQALAVAALVITTATTNRLFLPSDAPWRFLRLNLSSNTNVTLTANLWVI